MPLACGEALQKAGFVLFLNPPEYFIARNAGTGEGRPLFSENWQEKLWHLTLDAAHDTAKNIGPENCIHLAVATLHHYFLLAASTATPFPKNMDELRHALKYLGIILADVGLDMKMTTTCQEIRKEQSND